MTIAGLLLAAGRSTRMGGTNKLLQTVDSQPMLAAVITELMQSSIDALWVVTGFQSELVKPLLEKLAADQVLTAGKKIHCIENDDYAQGLSTSLKCGIQALPPSVAAVMIVQADMPQLSSQHFNQLLSAYKLAYKTANGALKLNGGSSESEYDKLDSGEKIIAPFYQCQRGNPIIFPRRFFASLIAIQGDQGARQLLQQFADQIVAVDMEDDAVLVDVDTPAQLHTARLRKKQERL